MPKNQEHEIKQAICSSNEATLTFRICEKRTWNYIFQTQFVRHEWMYQNAHTIAKLRTQKRWEGKSAVTIGAIKINQNNEVTNFLQIYPVSIQSSDVFSKTEKELQAKKDVKNTTKLTGEQERMLLSQPQPILLNNNGSYLGQLYSLEQRSHQKSVDTEVKKEFVKKLNEPVFKSFSGRNGFC